MDAIATLTAAFESPFGELGGNPAADSGIVVASWPSVPVEVIRAAGLTAVFARAAAMPTPAADRVLEAGVFPGRIHQLFEAALTGRLAHVAAIVLPRTSDPDYKAYLYLKELQRLGTQLPPVLLFDLLQAPGPDVAAYNATRVRELFTQLARLAGRGESVEGLGEQVVLANAAREAARRIAELRTARPRLAGAAAIPLLGAFWQTPPQRYCVLADSAVEILAARAPLAGPRVLLAGAPVDGSALHVAIESLRGTITGELSPFGSGAAATDVPSAGDPFASLAEWYARASLTPRLTGATLVRRVEELLPGVDAAVLLQPPSDARFGWEHARMRQLFARHGMPFAVLEFEPGPVPQAQVLQSLRELFAAAPCRQAARHG